MILDWREFSKRPEIKNLPLSEQKKKFYNENDRLTELNWFISTQMTMGGPGSGAAAGFTGQVIDGPINGATVTATSVAGASLGTATTNPLGVFTFIDVLPVGTTFAAAGGTDSITGVAYTGNMHAEISTDIGIGKRVTISPITTFAKYLKDERSITYDQAIEATFKSASAFFGTELDYDNRETILQKDFNAQALNGETEAVAALAVSSFMEGACEIMSSYEVGTGASTAKKDAAYLAMAKQMASFTSSINLSECLEEVASDNAAVSLVAAKRNKTNELLSNFKTDVFAVMDEQDKAPNYLVTKLNVLNRTGKRFAASEIASIKQAPVDGIVNGINTTVSTKYNAESGSISQIEEGVTNKLVAEAAGSYTPHQLLLVSFGPYGMNGTDVFTGNVTGTFHTVDDEIGVGTILYANKDGEAAQGATAAEVTTWNSTSAAQFSYNKTLPIIDHLHSNNYGILGDTLTTVLGRGGDIAGYCAEKFYKIQSKGSGSNSLWRVTEVYEGNPNKELSDGDLQKIRYSPVTQSYEFPPMDITIISGSNGLKIVTQEAIESEEESGEGAVAEQSFGLHNIKFYYTASAGTHFLSGSRQIANNALTYIQSNTHPDVKLAALNTQYYLQHKNRLLFKTPQSMYNQVYDGVAHTAFGEASAGQWQKISGNTNAVNASGGRVAVFAGELAEASFIFSGSNLGEEIS